MISEQEEYDLECCKLLLEEYEKLLVNGTANVTEKTIWCARGYIEGLVAGPEFQVEVRHNLKGCMISSWSIDLRPEIAFKEKECSLRLYDPNHSGRF